MQYSKLTRLVICSCLIVFSNTVFAFADGADSPDPGVNPVLIPSGPFGPPGFGMFHPNLMFQWFTGGAMTLPQGTQEEVGRIGRAAACLKEAEDNSTDFKASMTKLGQWDIYIRLREVGQSMNGCTLPAGKLGWICYDPAKFNLPGTANMLVNRTELNRLRNRYTNLSDAMILALVVHHELLHPGLKSRGFDDSHLGGFESNVLLGSVIGTKQRRQWEDMFPGKPFPGSVMRGNANDIESDDVPACMEE